MPEIRVLVTIENRTSSRYVLSELLKRPWAPKTEFKIIHVMEPPDASDLSASYWQQRKRLRKGVQFLLTDVATEIEKALAASQVTTEIREGDARQQILYVARNWQSDLIVLGTHGHSELNRFLIGSVAYPVSTHAPCSVMVV